MPSDNKAPEIQSWTLRILQFLQRAQFSEPPLPRASVHANTWLFLPRADSLGPGAISEYSLESIFPTAP